MLCDPADPGRSVLYEIYDDEEAFAAHLASSHNPSFAASADNQIDERAIRHLACLLQRGGEGEGIAE